VLLASGGIRYETDLDGRRTAKVFPDGKKERYTWNDADRLVAVSWNEDAHADGQVKSGRRWRAIACKTVRTGCTGHTGRGGAQVRKA
jgi:YD repeat-containing protein